MTVNAQTMAPMSVLFPAHERAEVKQVYSDVLTPEQMDEIDEAPEDELIRISFGFGHPTTVTVKPVL